MVRLTALRLAITNVLAIGLCVGCAAADREAGSVTESVATPMHQPTDTPTPSATRMGLPIPAATVLLDQAPDAEVVGEAGSGEEALEGVNAEPQVKALCWFLDYFPHDAQ